MGFCRRGGDGAAKGRGTIRPHARGGAASAAAAWRQPASEGEPDHHLAGNALALSHIALYAKVNKQRQRS